jgi:hypothetical protein
MRDRVRAFGSQRTLFVVEELRRDAGRVIVGALIVAAVVVSCADASDRREEPVRSAAQALAWGSAQTLVADDGELGDAFGSAVAMTPDWAVIGARWDDDFGSVSGSAYFLSRDGAGWIQKQKVYASDARMRRGFGAAVAIHAETAIIGTGQGGGDAAYVFTRSGSTWTEQQKLVAGNSLDGFGAAVALDGDTAVVGAPVTSGYRGLAYAFRRTGETWSAQELSASDGAPNDFFGGAVAVRGDVIWVGASRGSSGSGKVYCFVRSGDGWEEKATLVPDGDRSAGDSFGASLSANTTTLLIGSPGENAGSGSAYVFTGGGDTWSQQAKLSPTHGQPMDYFGRGVALEGDLAFVGADGDDTIANWSGAVYVFARVNEAWTLEQKVLSPNARNTDVFGYSIGLAGGRALVGAYGVDWNGAVFAIDYGDHVVPCAAGGECAGAAGCASSEDCASAGAAGAGGVEGEGGAGRPVQTAGLGGVGGAAGSPEAGEGGAEQEGPPQGGSGGHPDAGEGGTGGGDVAGTAGKPGHPAEGGSSALGGRSNGGGLGGRLATAGAAPVSSAGDGAAAGDSDPGNQGGQSGAPASAGGRMPRGTSVVRGGGCGCKAASSQTHESTWLALGLTLAFLRRRRSARRGFS